MAVEILESCFVAPGEVTPKHGLWLSNLDFMAARRYTPMVFFYRPSHRPASSPYVLKAALSKALVPFYPLAGRFAPDSTGRLEISCTGDGVLFVTARADATLDDMVDLAPSDELRRMLVPSAEGGDHAGVLAMFQVTFFRCGVVCLGTALHHTAADGRAFANFLNTWAAIARGVSEAAISRPCLDRPLLRARSPPAVRFDHAMNCCSGRGSSKPKVPFDTAILPVSRNQAEMLKGGAGAGAQGKKVTTFNAVADHVWQCACKARGLAGTQDTRLYMTADARSRVRPPLPDGYLGNAVVRALAVAKVHDIVSGALAAAADRVSDATARLSDEYIRSLVDYMEQATSNVAGLRIAEWPAIPETDLWITSWLGLPFSNVDFGWGRPAFIGRATIKHSGQVKLVSSPDGDGGLDVVVAMEPQSLARFKELFYEGLKRYSLVSQINVSDTHVVRRSKI